MPGVNIHDNIRYFKGLTPHEGCEQRQRAELHMFPSWIKRMSAWIIELQPFLSWQSEIRPKCSSFLRAHKGAACLPLGAARSSSIKGPASLEWPFILTWYGCGKLANILSDLQQALQLSLQQKSTHSKEALS